MTQIFGYSIPFPPWLTLSAFLVFWVAISFFVSHLFDRYIRRSAEKSKTRLDKLVIGALHVQHELRHRIFERLKKEGIEIPFPQRTVHLRREET